MHIAENKIRRIIRNILLEEMDSKKAFAKQVADILGDHYNINVLDTEADSIFEASNSWLSTVKQAGASVLGIKMSAPLLASLIIMFCEAKGIPISEFAKGAPDMAASLASQFNMGQNETLQILLNIASFLGGVAIMKNAQD